MIAANNEKKWYEFWKLRSVSRVFIPRKLLDFESVQARSLSEAWNKKLRTDYENLCIKKRDLYKFVHEF